MSYNPRKRQRLSPDPKDYPFVFFGTPLPPLDPEIRDDGTFVPLWKQEVRDERGRKRLHGAFTGGFSAGYFNTVGSKEGWTPSTFTSSRTNRAKATAMTAEDYMDEEDLAELAESQQVSTKSQFDGLGNTASELEDRRAGDLFDDLIKPKEDTMGVKILRKMGWREGQGVGPRVQRKMMDDDNDDDGEETYTLAPINTAIIALERKMNTNGLGYTSRPGLEKRVEKPSKKTISTSSKTGMRGSMGIGILNEDDDDDPYDVGFTRDQYSRTVVPKRDKTEKATFKVPAKHTFTFKPKSSSTADTAPANRRTHDGQLPLPGFSVSDTPFTLTTEWFSPPEILEGWTPLPPTLGAPISGPLARTQLAPKDRGALLGEKSLPGKSVFSFLTPEARARISQATGNTNLPPALNEVGPESSSSKSRGTATAKSSLPPVPKDTAVAALNGGFMPYGDNPQKQKRYRAYLEIQAELSERPLVRPSSMPADQWNHELSEFVRAAMVFKPMSRLMATRFTSSSSTILPGSDPSTPLLSVPVEKPEDPAIAAAKINMYGYLTRSTTDFYPTRLLCKRFNVKDPHPVGSAEEEHKETADTSLINAEAVKELKREARAVGTYDLANVEIPEEAVDVHADRNDVLEGERAGDEVFKSIFGEDSDDE